MEGSPGSGTRVHPHTHTHTHTCVRWVPLLTYFRAACLLPQQQLQTGSSCAGKLPARAGTACGGGGVDQCLPFSNCTGLTFAAGGKLGTPGKKGGGVATKNVEIEGVDSWLLDATKSIVCCRSGCFKFHPSLEVNFKHMQSLKLCICVLVSMVLNPFSVSTRFKMEAKLDVRSSTCYAIRVFNRKGKRLFLTV